MKFNVNNFVRVRLTQKGKQIMAQETYPCQPEEVDGGYTRWQLWELMNQFGEYCFNGCEVPFETEIEIEEPKY